MTRGRKPLMALREAGQIARKRGDTRHFMHEPGMICNFVIYCLAFVAHVRIKRVTRLRCTHAVIEREAMDALVELRAIASCPGISRELLSLSFPRLVPVFPGNGHRLIELERDGTVIQVPEKCGQASATQPVPATTGPAPVPADGSTSGISPPVPVSPTEISSEN